MVCSTISRLLFFFFYFFYRLIPWRIVARMSSFLSFACSVALDSESSYPFHTVFKLSIHSVLGRPRGLDSEPGLVYNRRAGWFVGILIWHFLWHNIPTLPNNSVACFTYMIILFKKQTTIVYKRISKNKWRRIHLILRKWNSIVEKEIRKVGVKRRGYI